MKPRFTQKQLWTVRNQIPIEQLIETQLHIPVRRDYKRLRFCCPVCHQYDTSVLYPKNLARCFGCQKNFNTIELTMQWAKYGFVQSVLWLQSLNTAPTDTRKDQSTPKRHSFTHISEIIPKIMPTKNPTALNPQPPAHHPTIVQRVDQMEKKIDTLDQKLDQLLKLLKSASI